MIDELAVAQNILRQQFPFVAESMIADLQTVSGGFSGAGVFKVECRETSYCLRRWPQVRTSAPRLLAIHQLLTLAGRKEIEVVPVPLRAAAGSTLTEANGALWQLEPWKPGGADFLQTPSDERLKSAMSRLAGFHNAIRDWVPTASVQKWFRPASSAASPTIAERIRMIENYEHSVADFEAALVRESDLRFKESGCRVTYLFRMGKRSVINDLKTVVDLCVPNQPCIRDLWHDHLLFSGDELTGIVDFGAMATDSVACDLSRLLGSLFDDDVNMWQRALSHYETIRPLTENDHRLLRPLDRSSVLLSGLTWLKRRYILHSTPDDLSPVCDRMDAIVSRLESLAETIGH